MGPQFLINPLEQAREETGHVAAKAGCWPLCPGLCRPGEGDEGWCQWACQESAMLCCLPHCHSTGSENQGQGYVSEFWFSKDKRAGCPQTEVGGRNVSRWQYPGSWFLMIPRGPGTLTPSPHLIEDWVEKETLNTGHFRGVTLGTPLRFCP